VREALRRRPLGRFALWAAIAAVHDEAPTYRDTDWVEIVALYDLLVQIWPLSFGPHRLNAGVEWRQTQKSDVAPKVLGATSEPHG
jgi:predicted RNA polymerase sigma factor